MNSQATDKPYLSIVIPAYNEEKRVATSLKDLQSFFAHFGRSVEVLIVIEKSTDKTVQIARDLVGQNPIFQIIANDVHKGKGFAVKTGMLRARGRYVFFMDLDLSTPLVEIVAFLNHFESHPEASVVIGSRQHAQSQVLKRQHPLRQKMGQTFNLFVQFLAFKGITDTQCGFKAFKSETIEPIFTRQTIDGFSFDVEILMIAKRLGYFIDVLPVKWVNSPDSKVRVVRDSLKMLIDLIRMRRLVSRTFRALPPGTNLK